MQDDEYLQAGAKIVDTKSAFGADIVLKVRPPNMLNEVPLFKLHSNLISYIQPAQNKELVEMLKERKMTVIGVVFLLHDAGPRSQIVRGITTVLY